jgi:hypothetical protein
MSIKNYKNIEEINLKTENEGQFIQDKDLFIVAKTLKDEKFKKFIKEYLEGYNDED